MRNHYQMRRLVAALLALSLLFVLMSLTARDRQGTTFVENVFSTLLYPFQIAADWTAARARSVGQGVRELANLREENAHLRSELERMAQFEARIDLLRHENETLRQELAIRQQGDYPLLTAEVIGRDPNQWLRTLVINRGGRDGVRPGMAVVNWQGLVGKVLRVTSFTATVQLLVDPGFGSDPGFAAGAKTAEQDLGYIVTQKDGTVRMSFHEREPGAKVGQPVFTSGQAVLPGNLLVGWIETIGHEAVQTYAALRPAVNFNRLEVVQVVMTQPAVSEEEEQQ